MIPLTLTCLSSVSQASNIETRIVGGNEAIPGEYPFMVSLQTNSGFHFYGASVISPTHVMTAAHCSDGTIYAVIGAHDLENNKNTQKIKVKKQIVHPDYGKSHDIAIYELSQPINSDLYSPIKLGSNNDAKPGTNTTVIGWGNLKNQERAPMSCKKSTSL